MTKLPWHVEAPTSSFLPQDYVHGRTETRFAALTVALFLVVMLCVVGAFLVTNRRWSSVREQQQAIGVEFEGEALKLDQLKELEKQRAEMLAKARVTTSLIDTAPRSVLMAELVTRLPDKATLTEVRLESKRVKAPPKEAAAADKEKVKSKSASKGKGSSKAKESAPPAEAEPPRIEYTLTIVGVAPTNTEIADFLAALQESPLLGSVDLASIDQTKLDEVVLRRFEINARLPEGADARKVIDAREVALDMSGVEIPAAPGRRTEAQEPAGGGKGG